MNHKDFRVQYPLWNIALIIILLIWLHGIVRFLDLAFNHFEGVFNYGTDQPIVNWNVLPLTTLLLGTGLLIIWLIAYFIRLKQHNNQNPTKKMFAFTMKPGEFLEDDEMVKHVTSHATKKVYVLYYTALPLIGLLMIFPVHRYIFILVLFGLLIIQQAVYYLEIRKYLSGVFPSTSEPSQEELKKLERKKVRIQKRMIIVLSVVLFSIIALTGIRLFQIENNHQANLVKAESCLEQEGTVIFEQENFWSLTTVTCEK